MGNTDKPDCNGLESGLGLPEGTVGCATAAEAIVSEINAATADKCARRPIDAMLTRDTFPAREAWLRSLHSRWR